jgi:hypothetical protein
MIKLIDILREIESNKILTPRRSEERDKKYADIINKQVQQYINNGSRGDFDLYNMQITSLPDNLKVGGSLNLEDNPITFLPNNLQVGKDLYLGNTEITSLPDNLKVGNDLTLLLLKITSLPNNLQIGRDLNLEGTLLAEKYTEEELRKMIEDKGGYVKGEIYL